MGNKTLYAKEIDSAWNFNKFRVEFFNEFNTRLVREFDSPYLAREFVNKIKHSKKCKLISYPLEV